MLTKQDFEKILFSKQFYDLGLIYVIENDGKYKKDYVINDVTKSYTQAVEFIMAASKKQYGFKIQGIEKYNKEIFDYCNNLSKKFKMPVDCHAYWGYAGRGSFKTHTDPCDVVIYICSGTKELVVEKDKKEISAGEHLHIAPGQKHKATNITDCLSLSFGTFEFDKDRLESLSFTI
jgi:mannose-6-phosphate isomerase-like protein (cupin superfamily)